ncbi:uncharacterized protein LOC107045590 [Diachasma alloeum]|uniref:uncharacterized protein LOC107045590 n=1 Tax=Diachasma alloeum TaxID=454923 RepID=UPI00073827BB|nr:uncharacterized protein LOC107045590 [Diachasma alloeum]
MSVYSKLFMQYSINEEDSIKLKINKDTPQRTLSSLLFSLFISDIEAHFRTFGLSGLGLRGSLEILLMAFADDIVILAESERDVQRKLDALESYCYLNSLQVNVPKTKVLVFHRSPKLKRIGSFHYGSQKVELVKEYTYLGIVFCSSGKFYQAAKDRISKASKASGATLNILSKAKPNSIFSTIKLLDNIIDTALLYGDECWAQEYVQELETIPSSFLKRALGLSRNTPHYLLGLETVRTSLEVEVLKRNLGWLGKLVAMPNDRIPKKMPPEDVIRCRVPNFFTNSQLDLQAENSTR